jgi:hypothetical protein
LYKKCPWHKIFIDGAAACCAAACLYSLRLHAPVLQQSHHGV